jgi:hypothetical protein
MFARLNKLLTFTILSFRATDIASTNVFGRCDKGTVPASRLGLVELVSLRNSA